MLISLFRAASQDKSYVIYNVSKKIIIINIIYDDDENNKYIVIYRLQNRLNSDINNK